VVELDKTMMKRKPVVYAFIDSQNLNLGIRDQGWELDFARFRIYLKDKYHVQKAFLFIGYIPSNKTLYTFLRRAGYKMIFKPTLPRKEKGETKGNVDAELVLHAMIQFPNYKKAIIVSGDGDFCCLIEYLKKKGKLLYVLIPNSRKYSALLRKFRRNLVYMDNLRKKLGRIRRISASKTKKRGSNLRMKP